MIVLRTPGALEDRLLREALAPLGRTLATADDDAAEGQMPALAVVWSADGALQTVPDARNIILIAPVGADTSSIAADAVIALPVRPGDITDRARTLLARAAHSDFPDRIDLGIYDFMPRENTVHHKKTKQLLRLTDKERDILLTLHHAAGKPVSRQELLDSVWAYAPDVETHTLETHIYRLRQKIETDPAAPSIILTDEQGYRMLPA